MGHPCEGFGLESAEEAFAHFSGHLELVEDYGGTCGGNCLHTWDDGGRALLRCKACGGYLLSQSSEYHGAFGDDAWYEDYFPVSGPEEAAELNRTLDGWQIERQFARRYLMRDSGAAPHWSRS